ncbi:MAG: kelch repeat-containing protein [Candidatus Accumulibacter necessarius]|jgi:hypothetical protein|uniref:kelch repeat-containing protein n=1 Tax=Candidatus Accumulibacter necessarius TaxID=2954386 RepID=UPI002FC3B0D8
MNDFTIARTADTAVKIGDSFAATNQVGIEVNAIPQLPAGTTVRVTVTVGCGAKEVDLLASRDEFLKVTGQSAGKTAKIIPLQNPPAGKKAWNTGPVPTALPVSISLQGFVSNTPPGNAEIEVLVETSTGRQQWSTGEKSSITVKKELEPRGKPDIRYFTVNPNYILHAGQTGVTVGFCATGYDTLTLFRNNEEVGNWTAQDAGNRIISGAFPVLGQFPETEKPSITSVYRLEGKYKEPADQTEVRNALDRTVQVISPGWNRIALPQGSPVRLFVATDFSGSGSDRLYGIFKNGLGTYALYSSATGVDAWRPEPGDVPQHMATSPGIYYKNKLWLIGGSSVDPDSPRNEVWCHGADQSWKREEDFPPTMPARMGHACLVFNDTLWVIGGYNNGTAYRDVWQGKEKPDAQLEWSPLPEEKSTVPREGPPLAKPCEWAGRLNPAAAAWTPPDGSPEVWIYGGSKSPQTPDPLRDFWSTRDGETWQEMDENRRPPVPIMPDPGAPLASALVAFRQTESPEMPQSDRLLLMGSFKELATNGNGKDQGNRIFSFLFEWHPGTGLWEGRPVFDGWQQFQGQNFYMQAVVFNRFLFCWSLLKDPESTGKLNILVSH